MANPAYLTTAKTKSLSSFNLLEANYNVFLLFKKASKTISLSSFNLAEANYNAYPDY
jgi:hypothetical protein